jgi:hypothetical protein
MQMSAHRGEADAEILANFPVRKSRKQQLDHALLPWSQSVKAVLLAVGAG